ncbi:MAG: glycosyltransferase [Muribaculaceae bacterium]|nr:glycosyltransferase [Muribaculaceae bacterium]
MSKLKSLIKKQKTKPRIFIHMHYLEIGGAETSLIGLLQALDPNRVDVDLFLNEHRGEMMKYIPSYVRVLPELKPYSTIEQPIVAAIKKGCWGIVIGRLMARLKYLCFRKKEVEAAESALYAYVGKYVTRFLPSLNKYGEYDLAISFLIPHNIVLEKVNAKKKICWIHTDYSSIKVDKDEEETVWGAYDNIVSISPKVSESFCSVFPTLSNKLVEIENIIPRQVVLTRSREFLPLDMPNFDTGLNLLTIGRYSYAKGLDRIPALCRKIIDSGLNIRWYIIGYGNNNLLAEIERQIGLYKVEDRVIVLGKKDNPYPYIMQCDWYIQPSRYEGKCVAVREAQLLEKPVIITDYPTALSQIIDGHDGFIVPNDIEACSEGIAKLLTNEDAKATVINNLRKVDAAGASEINKLYNFVQ